MKFNAITITILGLFALAAVPLAFGWWRRLRVGALPLVPVGTPVLTVVTISYLWVLALLFWPELFGPDYSSLRFGTISVNVFVTSLFAVIACVFGRTQRGLLVTGAAWVLLLWMYVGVVSSAV